MEGRKEKNQGWHLNIWLEQLAHLDAKDFRNSRSGRKGIECSALGSITNDFDYRWHETQIKITSLVKEL